MLQHMGLEARKPVFGVLRITKAQTSVAVMFPIMDMANKIIRNFDDKFHKFFISKVSAQ